MLIHTPQKSRKLPQFTDWRQLPADVILSNDDGTGARTLTYDLSEA